MEDVEAAILVKEALRRLDARIKETRAQVKLATPLPRRPCVGSGKARRRL